MRTPYHDMLLLPGETPSRWDVFRRVGVEWRNWLWDQCSTWISHAKLVAQQIGRSLPDVMRCLMNPELWASYIRPIVRVFRVNLVEDLSWTDGKIPNDPESIITALEPWVRHQVLEWRACLDVIASRHVKALRIYDPSAGTLDNRKAVRRIILGLDAVFQYHPGWLGVTTAVALAYPVVVSRIF